MPLQICHSTYQCPSQDSVLHDLYKETQHSIPKIDNNFGRKSFKSHQNRITCYLDCFFHRVIGRNVEKNYKMGQFLSKFGHAED